MAASKRNPTPAPEPRTYAARKANEKRAIVSFTLAPETMDKLRTFAGENGVSMSAVVSLAISEYVKRHG